MKKMQLTALPEIPLINEKDDLSSIILNGLGKAGISLKEGDILVIAQKIVSKSEGRMVDLDTVTPSKRALKEAGKRDPRLFELILRESSEIMRQTENAIIVRHRLGFVMANAGIDMSNVPQTKERALLLPLNPDATCHDIQKNILDKTGVEVAIIINDSHGRAWRNGTVGVALGVCHLPALQDMRGWKDLYGRELKSTDVGYADELASAASLLMGQSGEATPIIHIRGFSYKGRKSTAKELIRPKSEDLFV